MYSITEIRHFAHSRCLNNHSDTLSPPFLIGKIILNRIYHCVTFLRKCLWFINVWCGISHPLLYTCHILMSGMSFFKFTVYTSNIYIRYCYNSLVLHNKPLQYTCKWLCIYLRYVILTYTCLLWALHVA